MKTRKSRIILGVIALLAVVMAAGGLSLTTAYAQGPWQGNPSRTTVHDNQAVLDLLKSTESDLFALRQSGKSWAEIAATKGVTEAALLDALLQPMNERHEWMAETYPQFDATAMAEQMRTQFTNDLKETEFGTLIDRHILGGGGLMGRWSNDNGFGGMHGRGMMGNQNNGFGGMMRGWNNDVNGFGPMHGWNDDDDANGLWMFGRGMMRGWNNPQNVTPEPAQ